MFRLNVLNNLRCIVNYGVQCSLQNYDTEYSYS